MSLDGNTQALQDLLNAVNELPKAVEVDATLTESGKAADAKVTGERINELSEHKADKSDIESAVNTALSEAKASGEFKGDTGQRGTGLLPITTTPSTYTTEVNGLTPAYRISLSTVKTQSGATEVYAGDTVRHSYYHYPVIYVDDSYVYCRTRVSIRGATGATGATGAAGSDANVTAENIQNALGYTPANEATVTQLSEQIVELKSGNVTVPDYWLDELETKSDAIQVAMETAGKNKSAFLWYTDAHWTTSSKQSPKLLKYLTENTPINKVNFGGDIIGDPTELTHDNIPYAYEWRSMIADVPKHHSVFGNHDVSHNSTDETIRKIAYSFMIAPEESADMVMGDGAYYYIDNNAEKTRYLYLEYLTSDHTAMMAQGSFIVDAIKSVPEGWHIVAINHRWFQYSSSSTPTVGSVPAYETEILSIFDAYNVRSSRDGSNYFYAQDFADCKGKVEFCIGGHIHVDYDFTSTGGIPIIITASDTNQERSSGDEEDSGTVGTITESAVYGIIADYENEKITVVGVGRGGSRVIDMGEPEVVRLLNLDRTYVSGTANESLEKHLDESKAYLNVNYSTAKFYGSSCSVTDVTENSVTITESGAGGICVCYPIYLPDITTNAYRITFDYSGAGKCRTYYRYAIDGGISGVDALFINDTTGASGSADVTIPANTDGYTWLIILLGSNTGNTKTFTNVSLTKA